MELNFKIDKSWTLFLDRDGVINEKRENDYVKNWEEFEFIDGSVEAIAKFSKIFGKIVVVTNQRGVGKGLMSKSQLDLIHWRMQKELINQHAYIDKIYSCTCLSDDSDCRKPNVGMAIKSQNDYPLIDFNKSVMVGDSISDMQFGNRLGMKCIYISKFNLRDNLFAATHFESLYSFCISLEK
ncbi:HAD-IIIA family hydrolase [Aquirufa sp. HETE-83D]|uniref:D,D-heptose 1,7-bisphosphate phosphatase n=1 Tax=Aquirufa esocilacus TaxID=3096513 RepID=A0ABW6DSE8_9BACT